MIKKFVQTRTTLAACIALTIVAAGPAWAWEPTKPVEFVVPAGTGGGADQMARLVELPSPHIDTVYALMKLLAQGMEQARGAVRMQAIG